MLDVINQEVEVIVSTVMEVRHKGGALKPLHYSEATKDLELEQRIGKDLLKMLKRETPPQELLLSLAIQSVLTYYVTSEYNYWDSGGVVPSILQDLRQEGGWQLSIASLLTNFPF